MPLSPHIRFASALVLVPLGVASADASVFATSLVMTAGRDGGLMEGAGTAHSKFASRFERIAAADQTSENEDAAKQPLIVFKGEETHQDGTTEFGPEAETYIAPRYVTNKYLTIKSRADSLTIKAVTIDRGNCQPGYLKLPSTLKFGETLRLGLSCDPIEVVVDTDLGSYTFNWDQ